MNTKGINHYIRYDNVVRNFIHTVRGHICLLLRQRSQTHDSTQCLSPRPRGHYLQNNNTNNPCDSQPLVITCQREKNHILPILLLATFCDGDKSGCGPPVAVHDLIQPSNTPQGYSHHSLPCLLLSLSTSSCKIFEGMFKTNSHAHHCKIICKKGNFFQKICLLNDADS